MRIPRSRAIRVVGVYSVPFAEETRIVEVLVRAPAHQVDVRYFTPYRPARWDAAWEIGCPDFYLSEDGERLIGSYLDADLPYPDNDLAWPEADSRNFALEERMLEQVKRQMRARQARDRWTRFAMVFPDGNVPSAFFTPWGTLTVPEEEPIPARLLRLIWLE